MRDLKSPTEPGACKAHAADEQLMAVAIRSHGRAWTGAIARAGPMAATTCSGRPRPRHANRRPKIRPSTVLVRTCGLEEPADRHTTSSRLLTLQFLPTRPCSPTRCYAYRHAAAASFTGCHPRGTNSLQKAQRGCSFSSESACGVS